ncbi:MFS transporter [Bordetella genomosp. 11]|uniref:MFS transporter n=1 Tax=Bordetella genomosp. 11 TaxID=1416808 RepID=UPI000B9E7A1D|nr:MFS transporter [Bordetella genomosp. 11]
MQPTPRSSYPLDWLNFFIADVRDGLGPYLAIYLLAVHQWRPDRIGLVMTVSGLAALLAQTPAGAFVDRTANKRRLIIGAAVAVTVASLAILGSAGFSWVLLTQSLAGIASSIFAPAIAGITLGLCGAGAFTGRIARNESFNHAGNAFAALLAGGLAYLWGPAAVFYLMAAMALASIAAALAIPARIDVKLASGMLANPGPAHAAPVPLGQVLRNRSLLILAVSCALFHLANAAMLPLVGQKLALANPRLATPLTAACIVAAQFVMIPAALAVGRHADRIGRKPLMLIGFAILPLRGILYTFSDDSAWLVGVQLLDGVGAGIFGAALPLMVLDLTQGTGRFNASLAAVTTLFGIGAALSAGLAGVIVQHAGYSAAFLALAGIATLALVGLLALPETRRPTAPIAAPTQPAA